MTKLTYTLAGQRSAKLYVNKAQMRIASRSNSRANWSSFMPAVKWKTYFSNELEIDVKELPSGVELIGDFKLSATTDKKEINANEVVNVTLEIIGEGNLEDIKSFKPYVDDVSVFDEKIEILGNTLTQKIAFVAERDFTIPSFTLKYFDLKSEKVKTLSTKEIVVKVNNAKLKEKIEIQRAEESVEQTPVSVTKEFDKLTLIITFISGLLLGILIMLFKSYKFKKKDKKLSIKDPKNLLLKLVNHSDDEDVKMIVDKLEKSIYANEKLEIDKKILKEVLKRYDIS
ncbi:BatD family protein [Sulfurimonas sp.]|nr:BatD family protein [Sulfurimonas sp.]